VKRRTRLIVKLTATAVIVASIVLARMFSDDGVARFELAQAAFFFPFAIASLVLFAVMLVDFDKWVETVPPVPKRSLRRFIGRGAKRVGGVVAWVLALYGAGMTWFWSRVGNALGWAVGRSVARLTWFWAWFARAEGVALAQYGAAMQWVWSTVGRAFVSALAHAGNGLAFVWMWGVRGGLRVLVLYRAGMHRMWSGVGHAFVWTLAAAGRGLTELWVGAVRGGTWVLVRYRAVAGRASTSTGHALGWALAHGGAGLTLLWIGITRAGVWSFGRCRAAVRWLWLATVGRGDEPTPKPVRRWYTATVDAAFGIPPAGTSVDVFGGRVAPRVGRGVHREDETVGAVSHGDARQRRE
jgi:hypothetical protein